MLNKIYTYLLARQKQIAITLITLTILTFSGSMPQLPHSTITSAQKSGALEIEQLYSKSSLESLYAKNRYENLGVAIALNKELAKKQPLEASSLTEKASKVKNMTPFKEGTKAKNSANRFREWQQSNRKINTNSPRYYALSQLVEYGWEIDPQWGCLDRLWWHESNWNHKAGSPNAAYGIPQAAPGSKMQTAGKDWKTNPETQIDWGLEYIEKRYGTPCAAFKFWKAEAENGKRGYGWY